MEGMLKQPLGQDDCQEVVKIIMVDCNTGGDDDDDEDDNYS